MPRSAGYTTYHKNTYNNQKQQHGKSYNIYEESNKQASKLTGVDTGVTDYDSYVAANPTSSQAQQANGENLTQQMVEDIVKAMSDSLNSFATTNARAASEANAMQWAMFKQQMAYNQQEAQTNRDFNAQQADLSRQFSADQASIANAFTENMWGKAAEYNLTNAREARTWSAEQAQLQRDWQERMDNTQVLRRMQDLKSAGINPILAGGLTAGTPSGAMGTTSAPTMGSATGQQASSATASGSAASAGLPSAYMENTSNELALFGAAINAIGVGIDKLAKAGVHKTGLNLIKQFLH